VGETKEKTAGVFLLTRDNDYQRLQESDALATARRLKLRAHVFFAENSVRIQTSQIEDFIDAHPAESVVIVEAVDDESLAATAHRAAERTMGWFLLHRSAAYLYGLRSEFPTLPICTVTADHQEIGRIQGKQFVTLLRGRGTMLYVAGPDAASAARDRTAGVKEVLGDSPIDLHVVHGDWTEQSGETLVEAWLRAPEAASMSLALVGCQNDAMAAGALRALARASAMLGRDELAQVPVTGVDGTPEQGIPMVDRHRMAATVVMPPAAGHAVELVEKTWSTPGFAPPILVRQVVRSYPELAVVALRAR
jgi:ABC-type sugar transport system substrate-binding protein